MIATYNVYCDESCHLEHDKHRAMVLGAIWCPLERARDIAKNIRALLLKHNLSPKFEIKWVKVSPAKLDFYRDLISYFFCEKDLHFRGLIIPDKSKLKHENYNQDHDTWYYKMYFELLKAILDSQNKYRIYLDKKDTKSHSKVSKLHEILSNYMHDFDMTCIDWIQVVNSHEVIQVQLADLITGAISHINRGESRSNSKAALIKDIQSYSGYDLQQSTSLSELKLNLFRWKAAEIENGK